MAEKFEFGGGKALPEEMTGPVMPIPSEERWKASEKRRIAGVMRRRRGGLPEEDDARTADGEGGRGGAAVAAPATTMFDQVTCNFDRRLPNSFESSFDYVNVRYGWNTGFVRELGKNRLQTFEHGSA